MARFLIVPAICVLVIVGVVFYTTQSEDSSSNDVELYSDGYLNWLNYSFKLKKKLREGDRDWIGDSSIKAPDGSEDVSSSNKFKNGVFDASPLNSRSSNGRGTAGKNSNIRNGGNGGNGGNGNGNGNGNGGDASVRGRGRGARGGNGEDNFGGNRDLLKGDSNHQVQNFGPMNEAGKIINKLRKTIKKEKRILSRLQRLTKGRGGRGGKGARGGKGGGKQPESIVVHVGQIGPPGPRGDRGARGPDGKQGKTGPRGRQGKPGDKGRKGPRGDKGPIGPQGRQGPPGPRGMVGQDGKRGDEGPQGPRGLPGIRGFQGQPGPVGPQGKGGNQGPTGPVGAMGPPGANGPVGPVGPPGKMILPPPPPPPPAPTFHLRGRTTSAVNNAALSGVSVQAFIGNDLIGSATSANGNYDASGLRAGAYTIKGTLNGYCDVSSTYNMAAADGSLNLNFSPRLNDNQLRIVLTWSAQPSDLDSYLTAPNGCVTFYGNRNGCPGVQLDTDVTGGFGPETMTLLSPQPGIYRFKVNNYSRVNANMMRNGVGNPPATVTVYKGCTPFVFVCGRDGDVNEANQNWEVFTFNSQTGQISRS